MTKQSMLSFPNRHWHSGIELAKPGVYLKQWPMSFLDEDNVYTVHKGGNYSLIFCTGLGWHTDVQVGYSYSYLLVLVNEGFQVLQTGLPIKPQRRGDIIGLSLYNKHCLAQVRFNKPKPKWMALSVDLHEPFHAPAEALLTVQEAYRAVFADI